MNISLSSQQTDSISFKELMSRLGLHIAAQMMTTVIAGLAALKTDDWKAVTVFIFLILSNGLSVVTAFIDKSSSKFEGSLFEPPQQESPPAEEKLDSQTVTISTAGE